MGEFGMGRESEELAQGHPGKDIFKGQAVNQSMSHNLIKVSASCWRDLCLVAFVRSPAVLSSFPTAKIYF